mmetsp:Transcript_20153/g.77152  ORF Transcript_20153/g.77152 Transcript_20153/m.77152 type:complete len:224 (+) Transcript_20153:331-1002(+)
MSLWQECLWFRIENGVSVAEEGRDADVIALGNDYHVLLCLCYTSRESPPHREVNDSLANVHRRSIETEGLHEACVEVGHLLSKVLAVELSAKCLDSSGGLGRCSLVRENVEETHRGRRIRVRNRCENKAEDREGRPLVSIHRAGRSEALARHDHRQRLGLGTLLSLHAHLFPDRRKCRLSRPFADGRLLLRKELRQLDHRQARLLELQPVLQVLLVLRQPRAH